jgi:Fe-S-cluster-containing hydrogenase component 2
MAHTAQVEGDEAVAGLLAQEPGGTAMLMDASRCLRCALCALRCPTGSISMEQFQFLEEWTYAD